VSAGPACALLDLEEEGKVTGCGISSTTDNSATCDEIKAVWLFLSRLVQEPLSAGRLLLLNRVENLHAENQGLFGPIEELSCLSFHAERPKMCSALNSIAAARISQNRSMSTYARAARCV